MQPEHAELGASTASIWINCPGAPNLWREAPPKKDSPYAKEGTEAHELLELWARHVASGKMGAFIFPKKFNNRPEMQAAVKVCIDDLKKDWSPSSGKELIIEEKVYLKSVDPSGGMYGRVDLGIVEHFGLLDALDYKHGRGVRVEAYKETAMGEKIPNYQGLYYAIGLAEKYNFNFKEVRIRICQPRYLGRPPFSAVQISIKELIKYIDVFKFGVERTKARNAKRYAGPWCRFCKAKPICKEGSGNYRNDSRDDF